MTEDTGNQTSFLDQLVAQKGEQWSDPEVIAKGKLEGDQFIEQLKETNEQLRAELAEQDYAKKLLEAIEGQSKPAAAPVTPEAPKGDEGQSTAVPDVEALINEAITKREQASRTQANEAQVTEALQAKYGSDAGTKVMERAGELGMDPQSFVDMAKDSPTAFLSLMGVTAQARPAGIPANEMNTQGTQSKGSVRDKAYYDEIRKTNSRLYFSPKIQKQLYADRKELGANFYN